MDIWQLIAGLGLFLFGMGVLEQGLRELASGPLRDLLRRQARSVWRGVVIGAGASALLQSSSLVLLLTMAFVGVGVIDLRSAIGVISGANIGTSATGWLVVLAGFKFDLAGAAYALIGLSGIGLAFGVSGRIGALLRLVFGIGLVLLGLTWMKDGVEAWAQGFSVSPFAEMGPWTMALIGLALTAVIQASAATMLIALSALNGGVIGLEGAIGLVIGSNVGTTVTAILGAIGGTPDKKRAAAFHVIFNFSTALLVLPWVGLLAAVLAGIADPLIALTLFHTVFNVAGMLMFAPAAGPMAAWLGQRFGAAPALVASAIHRVPPNVPSAALEAISLDVTMALELSIYASRAAFSLPQTSDDANPAAPRGNWLSALSATESPYARLKRLEGELVEYAAKVVGGPLDSTAAHRIDALLEATRRAVLAAKAIKDVASNLADLDLRDVERVEPILDAIRRQCDRFLGDIAARTRDPAIETLAEALGAQHSAVRGFFDDLTERMYREAPELGLSSLELSSMLNVLRETRRSQKSLLRALARLRLNATEAALLDEAFA